MSSDCVQLSRPLDPVEVETLVVISAAAERLDIPLLIMGAFARDLWFEHVYGIPTERGTTDIDTAVHVPDWGRFGRLCATLLEHDRIAPVKDRLERLRYSGTQLLDIIPFGGVADAEGVIHWPPEGQTVMSVIGFEEAIAAAASFRLIPNDDSVVFRVVTIPALTVLKLVSWNDRPAVRARDIKDIGFILAHYLEIGNRDRVLSGEHTDLLESPDFDDWQVSARLLGRDMAALLEHRSRDTVSGILGREIEGRSHCPLIQELRRFLSGDFRRTRDVVRSLHAGLTERG